MKKDKTKLHEVWRNSGNLAREFIDKCTHDFGFLVNDYGFKYEAGLWDFSSPDSRLKRIPEELPYAFLCIVRFTKNSIKIEFSYGDREFLIEARIWFKLPDEKAKFGLWEILNAENIDYDDISGNMWVSTSDFLNRTIDKMQNTFKNHIDLFLNENPQIIRKALELREQRLKTDIGLQRQQGLEKARMKANGKFKEGKYIETIEILMQYGDMLSKADKAMLAISEKRAKK